MLLTLPLLNRVNSTTGWFTIQEADLLLSTTLKACISLQPPHNIIEIGSYMGRSTIILGSVIKEFFPDSKVFAIDPHKGDVSNPDDSIVTVTSSLDQFNTNISDAGLSDIVILINDYSYNVQWSEPISLLFIDGIHDYENVSRDFYHFESWVRSGGYVVFHDYSSFPGVTAFVDEILEGENYIAIAIMGSLVVIQKV
jgi:predicted O-methyltransferase YrrM